MSEERLQFQAEVSRLLEIVAKSLYSHKEVFLRELISNASDACDRLRYAGLTDPSLTADGAEFRIDLAVDKDARTLTVADNGIGMDRGELVEMLGTIARSGTLQFVDQLTGDAKKDMHLIGQFGVGFYSTFMVADRVTVLTRKAGTGQGWRWESDGRGEFTIAEADDLPRGTRVIVHLAESEDEFLDESRLRQIVKTYSDHIAIPIMLKGGAAAETEGEAPGDAQLNRASALWTRSKSDISEDDYKEFYHHVGHAFDEPWLTLHYRAEGMIEYTALVFVPTMAPFDLYHPERKHRLKLYVRRVFVTDAAEGLLPSYLRFLRGVVDSEDLPLNVSREMLQTNPLVARIRGGLTRRVLTELGKKAGDEPEAYANFWDQFGPVMKEGLYEDFENRDTLQDLLRFHSTAVDGLTSLDGYLARMKEGQEALFYITGDELEQLRRSPQLEGFRAKGVEVMLLTDPVDDFWIGTLGAYKDKPFKSATRGGADLSRIKAADKPEDEETDAETKTAESKTGLDTLLARFKLTLQDEVKDVRASERLTDSPVCLVADEGDMDMHLERLLKQHKQLGMDTAAKRILEINPDHPLVHRLTALATSASGEAGDGQLLEDMAHILLDQARIVEGEPLPDPSAFSRRLSLALQKGVTLAA
ncbi:MAG: molecular chaperone HtpG [Gammaproteobacteria bacterium]|jgi:molecular chaperone HtpG|nr:molecular chaperone HtpG [Gammaproteobacteria bacterium]